MANYYLGMAYQIPGDYRQAIDFLTKNVVFLQGSCSMSSSAWPACRRSARVWLVDCLAELGAFAEGIARGEEAIQIAEAVDHFNSLILAYWGLGADLRQGDLSGLSLLERALERCQAANLRGGCRGLLWAWARVCSVRASSCAAAVGAGGGARVRHGHDGQSVAPGDSSGRSVSGRWSPGGRARHVRQLSRACPDSQGTDTRHGPSGS